MASVIKSANLFSFKVMEILRRFRSKSYLRRNLFHYPGHHLCTLIFQLIKVFTSRTVTVESSTKSDLFSALVSITTIQNTPGVIPAMFAIDLQNGRGQLKTTSLNGSTLTVSDFYYVEEKNASATTVTRTHRPRTLYVLALLYCSWRQWKVYYLGTILFQLPASGSNLRNRR